MERSGSIGGVLRLVRDQSRLFTLLLPLGWIAAVAVPILVSVQAARPWGGAPLAGVVLWFGVLRLARWLSPPARADALMRRGKPAQALALCTQALAVSGPGAWVGLRRLIWLNRRTSALLALGRPDEALASALDALAICADPETLGNCALALLRLNRYEEAAHAARLALALTRERSVISQAVLAQVMLAGNRPAEAEALARAGLEDATALLPMVRADHYALCLAAVLRALQIQDITEPMPRYRADLRKATRGTALRALALMEEVNAVAPVSAADPSTTQDADYDAAFALLTEATALAPEYVYWYTSQPGTLAALRHDARFLALQRAAESVFEGYRTAPAEATVAAALDYARRTGSARPAPQSSREALLVQVVTLGSTFALLLLWTWRFFLYGT